MLSKFNRCFATPGIAKPTLSTRLDGDKVDSKESRWPSCPSVGLLCGAGKN